MNGKESDFKEQSELTNKSMDSETVTSEMPSLRLSFGLGGLSKIKSMSIKLRNILMQEGLNLNITKD